MFCVSLSSSVRDIVEVEVFPVHQDHRVVSPVDPPARPPAALPPVDHAHHRYLGVMVHLASWIDGVSRGRYRETMRCIMVVYIYVYIFTMHSVCARVRLHESITVIVDFNLSLLLVTYFFLVHFFRYYVYIRYIIIIAKRKKCLKNNF